MLKSLRARNIALMAVVLVVAQLLTMLLISTLLIWPQADRVGAIVARNVVSVGAVLDRLPDGERNALIAAINDKGSFRILPESAVPPSGGRATLLERTVMLSLARELGQHDTLEWRGGGLDPLWLRVRLGANNYWVSVEPTRGWTPNGALLASVGIALALSLFAGVMLQRRLNRPIRTLAAAVDAMPHDHAAHPLAVDGPEEIVAVARAFNRMAARLAAQDADRAFMLAGLSHDLKTPLAKLQLAFALSVIADTEQSAMVERQFDRMDRMLGQFLDFGRGIDGEAMEPVPVASAIRDAIAAVGSGAPVELISPESLYVRVRPRAFERALVNLLRNAQVHGAPPFIVTATGGPTEIRIVVTDGGKGVPEALLCKLSQPFVRADVSRPSDGGVGLGLSIAARFAFDHAGVLELANCVSGGFAAALVLPRTIGTDKVGSASSAIQARS